MLRISVKYLFSRQPVVVSNRINVRNFLSDAYYCRNAWQSRFVSPILQKINPDILYHELDQRFQKARTISSVDVDIFANSLKDSLFVDELLDLVHKLRLSNDTVNTLESTTHAVVRLLFEHDKTEELLLALDDRLNYGLFLDPFTANLILDHYHKVNDHTSGAFVAGQLMLQEDLEHPVTTAYSILHCYNYLRAPGNWPQAKPPQVPEEEIKVRVKFVRNPYDDNHFDLKDPAKIIGKTLQAFCTANDPVQLSLRLVGFALSNLEEQFNKEVDKCKKNPDLKLVPSIIELAPEEFRNQLSDLKQDSRTVEGIVEELERNLKAVVNEYSESDIGNQCKLYKTWEETRIEALEAQRKRIDISNRLERIQQLEKDLREKEQKLWFFENEEAIELAIEKADEEARVKATETHFKTGGKKNDDENYVPPEIVKRIQQ